MFRFTDFLAAEKEQEKINQRNKKNSGRELRLNRVSKARTTGSLSSTNRSGRNWVRKQMQHRLNISPRGLGAAQLSCYTDGKFGSDDSV